MKKSICIFCLIVTASFFCFSLNVQNSFAASIPVYVDNTARVTPKVVNSKNDYTLKVSLVLRGALNDFSCVSVDYLSPGGTNTFSVITNQQPHESGYLEIEQAVPSYARKAGTYIVKCITVSNKYGSSVSYYDSNYPYSLPSSSTPTSDLSDLVFTLCEHDFVKTQAKEATCTEDGNIEYWRCNNCGKYYADANGKYELTQNDTIIVCEGHKWNDDYTIDKAITCEQSGKKSIHCGVCDAIKENSTVELEAKGHNWDDDYTVDKAATCTEEGSKSIHCSECDTTKDVRTISALGHEYESETNKATASKNGSVVTKCSGCGDVKSSETIYYPKTLKLSMTNYTYSGGVKTPTVSIIDANGKTVSSANYNVSYASGRKSVGKYKVTVTFKGDKYSGSKYTYFYINPKGTSISKVTRAKKAFTVKWKKQSSKMATSTITGYQIRYSTSSKMTSPKYKTIKGYSYTSKKVTKLSAKKTYYVQVRTYKTVSGKNYYSSWSSVKSVRTK